jgi:serine/threonine protein kinase/tetratricopeptide (TPR) repeat protein
MPSTQDREAALFLLAIEKPVGERAALLQAVCGEENELRARLEALLAVHDQGEDPIDAQIEAARPTLQVAPPDRAGEEIVGQMIGRYKLLEKLGEGGCGIVYVAEQVEPVRRRVALKVIKLGMDSKEVIARFEAERQALAMMDHPNIARALDAGATETGRPYFVMELVRGIRITEYCDQSRLTTRERLDLFLKVCQAIQHAHQKGIIHRDIKPSNILVTLHDGVPVPKVIDFGIAKAIEGRLTEATVYTQFHHFVGTPAYMSPEQAEMSGLDIDTRSDIYSLGVLLYELLTGRTPFDSSELLSMGMDQMRKTIREREPSSPSLKLATLEAAELTTTALRRSSDAPRLIHLLQGDIDWIVLRCLEKDRSRRYAAANSLAADITRHLNHEPVNARPPSAAYRLQKAFRRHRLGFLATGAVGLALLVGLTASVWQAVRATRAEALASKRLAESEAVSSFLTEVFQSPDPARDGRSVTVAETLDTAVQRLNSDLSSQPARRAQLQATVGKTYLTLGLPSEAIPLLQQAQSYFQSTLGNDHQDTRAVMRWLGLAMAGAGRRDEAIQMQLDLLARHRRLHSEQSREALLVMMDLGHTYIMARRAEEGRALLEEALRLSRKVNGTEHPDTIRAMHALAQCYQPGQSLKLREETYALSHRVNGATHPATLLAGVSLELAYSAQGRDVDLMKLLEEVVPLSFKINGPEHQYTRRALNELERAYYAAGRWQDALQLKADYARWNPKDLNTDLLVVQAWFGQQSDYEASCRRLLKFAEETSVLTTAERAAKACLLLPTTNRTVLDGAHSLARRAVDLGAEHQFFGWFQFALGMAEFRLGNYRAADKAFATSERMAPINTGFFHAMSLYRQGQAAEARRLFDLAASQMRALPDDDQNPLASGASGDDMVIWLAYREAAAMLGIEPSAQSSLTAWLRNLEEDVGNAPADSIRSLHLATVLLWLGKNAEHESHCRRIFAEAASSDEPAVLDRAAKAYLLQSKPDPQTLKLAFSAARRAFELAPTDDPNVPWFYTVAGMAAFREGKLGEAETLLSKATANPLHENQRRLAVAFRAMTRFQAGRQDDARADLSELTKLNLTLPDRTRMSPLLREQDQLAVRLAYKETVDRLNGGSSPN